ncbi:MAG TPA: hypothetical protein VGJ21_11785 [Terracidiphilus sp.]
MARTAEGKTLLRRFLKEVTEGPAFRGSMRSAQFLEYVVWQSAVGKVADLKERTIGIKLFGRRPAYDTGEDAIVRVTASDVRKRLMQHYSGIGSGCEFRIMLPSGGYVPELIRASKAETDGLTTQVFADARLVKAPLQGSASSNLQNSDTSANWKDWILSVLGIVALAVGIALTVVNRPGLTAFSGKSVGRPNAAPWMTLFDGSRRVLIIASDPNIEEIQRISHSNLSLSDYANQSYLPPDAGDLSPFQVNLMKELLRGNKILAFDGSIIANLASLTIPGHNRLLVKAARDFRAKDLQTDENLVFLGSPRSNPWTSVFDPVLDFQFVFDPQTQREFIRNVHPGKGEYNEYVPIAGDFDTGESFALISVFHNPGYGGRVLIIAGASGEGTEAAGDLVADPARWTATLHSCNIDKDISHQSVQVLLHLETIAGSPSAVSTVACHLLTPGS